jgi:DNA invertase Pin-like site-specific DNA recombinase
MTTTLAMCAADYADVSDPSGEPIAVWERVSTDMSRQDITSQTRDLKSYIGAGSYSVVRVFRFEASAFHGKHTGQQAEMMADVEAGRYATIVAAMTSRYERRGWQHAMITALQLHTMGARIVAIDDASYGDMSSVMGAFGTIMKAEGNHDYSKAISDNVSRKFRVMDAAGYHRGGIPAGYAAEGVKGEKKLAPHPVAAAIVIESFTDSAAGKSTPKVARTFKAANERYGLRLPVTADGVAKMLRSPEYSTGHHKAGSACRCKFAPLVSPAQQKLAVAALEARRTGDNVSSRRGPGEANPDFSGALWCAACGAGRMYRYSGGRKLHKNGSYSPPVRRYHCEACGKSVKADAADQAVNDLMSSDRATWYVPFATDPNADRDRALEAVKTALAGLASQGLDRRAEQAARESLWTEQDRLGAIPDQPAETFGVPRRDAEGRALTEGDRWVQFSPAERRDWLSAGEPFRILVKSAPGRTGAVEVSQETTVE